MNQQQKNTIWLLVFTLNLLKISLLLKKGGLKSGDVIIEADGKSITTMDELNEIKNSHQIGDSMKLKINRNGSEKEITLTLGEQP